MGDLTETITGSRRIFSGRVVTLDVHDVRLPDGSAGVREQIEHPGAVGVVALDADDTVLLVRQYRLPAQQVTSELPAGTLEPGEPPATCAIRELQEETGYKPGTLTPIGGHYAAPGYTTEYIHLFLATDLTESRLDGDRDEFIELERVPLKDAVQRVMDGDIVDSKTIHGLLRVARMRGI